MYVQAHHGRRHSKSQTEDRSITCSRCSKKVVGLVAEVAVTAACPCRKKRSTSFRQIGLFHGHFDRGSQVPPPISMHKLPFNIMAKQSQPYRTPGLTELLFVKYPPQKQNGPNHNRLVVSPALVLIRPVH
jgi:hypothetical protein